ncbi:hypothetical protein LTS14_004994 [Recurvomyces mirabilis]|uniref:uncharacterized protein n=1 Tax=Recurvomyces mirabilis TaxID=574656 RepID=UPI002DDFDAC8|nr:hypothetical protein LTS14_004994 [Recurvomyces mirabilis]
MKGVKSTERHISRCSRVRTYSKSSWALGDNAIGTWTQGDFIRMDTKTQGIQFMGRSDGVLNPSGVRFGSAEVYNCLTTFADLEDSLCVGRRRPQDSDELVLLFVKMKSGHPFSNELRAAINERIRTQLSARHVPAFTCETPDIPMTVNGKKTEVVVKKIVSGQKIIPSSTIVNPGSLRWYEQFASMETKLFRNDEPRRIKL